MLGIRILFFSGLGFNGGILANSDLNYMLAGFMVAGRD